ncbi:uncharacterized protein DMENIID0001_064020 [Sergentomyia squamirostris]
MKWNQLIVCNLIVMVLLLHICDSLNSTQVTERHKRYLFYPLGGLVKIIMGFNIPLTLTNKRSMGCAWTLQGQFRVPSTIQWFPTTLEGINSRKAKRDFLDNPDLYAVDESRKVVYFMLEGIKNWMGKNGRQCLLRTICEVSQSPLTDSSGIFGELIDSIFIPGTSRVDDHYHDAQSAGESGVDCRKMYRHCPIGDGFLDEFLLDQLIV